MLKPFSSLVFALAFSTAAFVVAADAQKPAAASKPKAVTAGKPKAVADDGPPLLPHPHEIFVDAEHNKLFWPMDMPFWVRLTASPDADAPSYLLQRVAPESNITTEKYNKEGIGLEIQGQQFIRWFNYVTKQTVNLQFYTDGTPPLTKAACTGAPTVVESGITYFGKGLRCALASVDDLSGVETVFASINDAPYKPYVAELSLNKEMAVVLRYYAVDHVGYAETPSALRFTVDLSPPSTTYLISGNSLGQILSSQAKFHIASSDTLSGVAGIQVRFDQQDFKTTMGGDFTVSNLPDGEHTLSYYAVDRVGNTEPEHVVPFYLDRLPPTVDAQVLGDLFVAPNGTRYVSGRSQLQLSAQDNKSGVDKIVYSFDAVKFQQYTAPVPVPVHAGTAKVVYRASDKLGNTSALATLPYSMDIVAPQTTYRITGPIYQQRSDIYITSASHIELSATDDASGVQSIHFQPEGDPQPGAYTAPLSFPDEGRRLLRYWSVDRVNNREPDHALVLITDNTPPEIFANFSLSPLAAAAGQGLPVYRSQTSLFLGATDNAAGVHKIYYSFNGGKEMEYTKPLSLDTDGTFDLLIRADDNLGNQTSKHLRFVIRD